MTEDIVSFAGLNETVSPFWVQMAGISYCDGNYHIRRRNSSVCVIEQVVGGSGTVHVNGTTFTATAGDVYLLPRGSDHEYASSRNDPWTKIWFNAAGPLTDALISLYHLNSVYHISGCDVRDIFERILKAARGTDSTVAIFDGIALLCHELMQRISSHTCAGSFKERSEGEVLHDFINRNIDRDLDVSDMAACIYRSVSQTIRIFKKAYGVTPYKYLLSKRMEAARLMLIDTRLPVKEIAYRLRFADEHYFSNCFRAREGVSPAYFRMRER